MFMNKSAWFSNSVPQACHDFWITEKGCRQTAFIVALVDESNTMVTAYIFPAALEGGSIAGWGTADYLFSEDATCPDTLRIFESKYYLWNKVVVFHCLFLSICEKRQSVKSVSIGHFVLPPVSVQREVRNVAGRLIWECEDEQSVARHSHKSSSRQAEEEHTEGEVSRINSVPSDTDSSESEARLCVRLQEYPVYNMLPAGYVSMDNLRKHSGDLCDFRPGCFQCSNCKAHCRLPHASK